MTNSVDPDQLAFSQANWSGSTLFAKAYLGPAGPGLITIAGLFVVMIGTVRKEKATLSTQD